jgi:hypothetical protein
MTHESPVSARVIADSASSHELLDVLIDRRGDSQESALLGQQVVKVNRLPSWVPANSGASIGAHGRPMIAASIIALVFDTDDDRGSDTANRRNRRGSRGSTGFCTAAVDRPQRAADRRRELSAQRWSYTVRPNEHVDLTQFRMWTAPQQPESTAAQTRPPRSTPR